MLTYVEAPGSRKSTKNVTTGELQVGELLYTVWEESNDATVRNYVETWIPRKYENLVLDTYDMDEDTQAPGQWRVSAKYILPSNSKTQNDGQPVGFTFSTVGGSQNIKYGLQNRGLEWCQGFGFESDGTPRTKPPFRGALNVGADGSVEGTDKYIAALEFGLTYNVLSNAINIFAIHAISGKINATQWRGFAAQELLFLGVEGSGDFLPNGQGSGKLTYKFMGQPSKSVVVSNSNAIPARGWDYVWVRFKQRNDDPAKTTVVNPEIVSVDRVYETADFNLLGIL
jgi:hypothetical protein